MAAKFCNSGTLIEEEDFCRWTEKDVEFKCFEGLDAKLKKFYSWNKAIKVEIEIDGTVFCGILIQENNSFAPVLFGSPKRSPLQCITPSKPKAPKRKKDIKPSSFNAYSRENWPRVYIDSRNTVEQRLRFKKDKNLSNNRSNTSSKIGKENSHPRTKKLGVSVYNKWKKLRFEQKSENLEDTSRLRRIGKGNSHPGAKKLDVSVYNKRKKSRFEQKSENLAENNSRCRRSKRLRNSSNKLQQIKEANSFKTESNYKSLAIGFGHVSPKGNKNVAKSVGYKDKECDALWKTSILPKPHLRSRGAKCRNEPEFINLDSESNVTLSSYNLRNRGAEYGNEPEFIHLGSASNETLSSHNPRPRGEKYGNEPEFINSDTESNETLSISQYRLIDVTVSLTKCADKIQHPTDIDKTAEIKKTSAHPISQYHSVINRKNKGKNKIFDSAVLSSTLNVDKTIKSTSSKSRNKKNKAFEKECSDLSDKFDKMTIKEASFGPPIMQSSSKREYNSQGDWDFKISELEMPTLEPISNC